MSKVIITRRTFSREYEKDLIDFAFKPIESNEVQTSQNMTSPNQRTAPKRVGCKLTEVFRCPHSIRDTLSEPWYCSKGGYLDKRKIISQAFEGIPCLCADFPPAIN